MITPQHSSGNDDQTVVAVSPVPDISPVDTESPRVSLYSEEFAADPHGVYARMRAQFGPLARIELAPGVPATLVLGHREALRILNDPEHFPVDPRGWQHKVPGDSPILPLMQWYPNALRSDGDEHQRYRQAYVASIDGIDLYKLQSMVEQLAIPLINNFCENGSAELIGQYTFPLVFDVVNHVLGCPRELGQRVATGTALLFDTAEAAKGMEMLVTALLELIQLRRDDPGDDVTSRMVQHGAGFTDEEMMSQLVCLYGASIEPQQNLINNTLLAMLTDERSGGILGGALSTQEAIEEVLFNDPPVANFCTTYPKQPILIDNQWLPAHEPILVSLAGCNHDPALGGTDRNGNRAHLSWGAGQHSCPARSVAYVVAREAIDHLLDALPEMSLAEPLAQMSWRPGPFHRALAALPVTFPKSPRLPVR
ncbi:cytochrome P450 family protein [Nocardia callitridis]|uniref:Cytochrome P450 n=1 Tax=Nocardia callitridis TaxID=648753 RepID=A0ABP9KPL7_9NOCA